MANKAKTPDPLLDRLDELVDAVQDLFILQALASDMKAEDIRKILHIDNWRVTNISKYMKRRRGGSARNTPTKEV